MRTLSILLSAALLMSGVPARASGSKPVVRATPYVIRSLDFSPSGRYIALASGAYVHFWDMTTGKTVTPAFNPYDPKQKRVNYTGVTAVAYSPVGSAMALGTDVTVWGRVFKTKISDSYRTVIVWSLKDSARAAQLGKHKFSVGELVYSPDGKFLAVAGEMNEFISVYDTRTWKRVFHRDKGMSWVRTAAFSPDSRTLAYYEGFGSGRIHLLDLSTKRETRVISKDASLLYDLAFSPDGKLLAGTNGPLVRLWDPATGKEKGKLEGHGDKFVKHLAFSPDGLILASAGSDKTLRLWDVPTRTARNVVPMHTGNAGPLDFSPDGKTLAAAGGDGHVHFFDMDTLAPGTAAPAPKPKAPPKLSIEVAFKEPSGNDLLDAGESGALRVKISNTGPGAAFNVRLSLSPVAVTGLDLPLLTSVGALGSGESVVKELPLKAAGWIKTASVSTTLKALEGNGFDSPPTRIEFRTQAFLSPKLRLAGVSMGGSGVVKTSEINRLTLTVRNAGRGPAKSVKAAMILGKGVFPDGEDAVTLGGMAPGETKTVDFAFFVSSRRKDRTIPLSVRLTEALGKYGTEADLGLMTGEPPRAKRVIVAGRAPAPAAPALPSAEDVDSPPARALPIDPEAYAVVVGVERYRQKGLPPVDFAARDAQTVHTYLTRSMGFDPKNVVLIQDQEATKTDLQKYLGPWLRNRVTDKSRVLVFFAGHGAPDPKTGEGFLLPYDGDPGYTQITAFPLKELYANLAKLPSRDVTVVLDACFSGRGSRSVIKKGARPLILKVSKETAGENTVTLSATGNDQISTYYPDGRHGLLTYYLLKGLRGKADSDADGRVTTSELFRYLRPAVEREARRQNIEQTPTLSPPLGGLGPKAGRVWTRTR